MPTLDASSPRRDFDAVRAPALQVLSTSSFRSDSGNLDLIRAVAVLSVYFAHIVEHFDRASLGAWHFAQMGVLIFFVHTSMVLMLSLERTKLTGGALIGAFYLRRVFRLYPLSMMCVTIAMLFDRSPDPDVLSRDWRWTEYLSNMALTTNLTFTDNMVGGLWTLPLEMQMYVVLPFLFLIGRAQPRRVLFLIWLLAIPVALVQLRFIGRLSVLGYVPCFMAGVIAWRLSVSVPRHFGGWAWPLAFVATWPLFLLATHEHDMYFRWAFCLALGVAIPWFQELRFPLATQVLHLIAKYSYGIYLSHVAIILWAFALPVSRGMQWAALAVASLGAPVAMFHLIEQPMIRVGQRVSARLFRASDRDLHSVGWRRE